MSSPTSRSRTLDVPVVLHDPINNQSRTLDWLNAPYLKINEITSFTEYYIKNVEAYRADILSFKFYGTVDYWYVIPQYNGILNPLQDLHEGLKIKVPPLVAIQNAIASGLNEIQNIGPLSSGGENAPTPNTFIEIE